MASEIPAKSSEGYIIGIDVGTGSVRAALFSKRGKLQQVSSRPIQTWNPQPNYFEQSSDNIWKSTCSAVRELIENRNPDSVLAIGVDATCSLVALDKTHQPVSVSLTENDNQNIILWMDHRASGEAEMINATNHSVLKTVGGKISLEMEIPKILWLKNHLRDSYDRVGLLFDLPDFMTWKMTGSETRSLCSLVCKWNYQYDNFEQHTWSGDFFARIGLEELIDDGGKKIGQMFSAPGAPCGEGLSATAAADMGLRIGTPVSTSIIDAHAGGVGMIGTSARYIVDEFKTRLCVIAGTSTCHMAVSQKQLYVKGVWGPYYSAMVPNYFLNEAGQSAAGKLIDHIIQNHPATLHIQQTQEMRNTPGQVQDYLADLLAKMAKDRKLPGIAMLTEELHVYPDFHGNRSPLADPSFRGMISGLTLAADEENLALLYLATIQGLAYSSLHILEVLKEAGHDILSLVMCGGLSRNMIYVETHADVLRLPVLCPHETESVMLGAAILGAAAGQIYEDVESSIRAMSGTANVVHPRVVESRYHAKKYQVYKKMIEHQSSYKGIMTSN